VLGQTLIGPLLANFLNEYPDVRLVSVLSDHVVHLLRSGFDLALAALLALRAIFERKGKPQGHVELPRFDLLATGTIDRRQKWATGGRRSGSRSRRGRPPTTSGSSATAIEMARVAEARRSRKSTLCQKS
jgi:DNA-binding transcriptional LysR family regulator